MRDAYKYTYVYVVFGIYHYIFIVHVKVAFGLQEHVCHINLETLACMKKNTYIFSLYVY